MRDRRARDRTGPSAARARCCRCIVGMSAWSPPMPSPQLGDLLVVDGGAAQPDQCVGRHEVTYVVNGALPRAGTICRQDTSRSPAERKPNGPSRRRGARGSRDGVSVRVGASQWPRALVATRSATGHTDAIRGRPRRSGPSDSAIRGPGLPGSGGTSRRTIWRPSPTKSRATGEEGGAPDRSAPLIGLAPGGRGDRFAREVRAKCGSGRSVGRRRCSSSSRQARARQTWRVQPAGDELVVADLQARTVSALGGTLVYARVTRPRRRDRVRVRACT
jgi:hypothetical protein